MEGIQHDKFTTGAKGQFGKHEKEKPLVLSNKNIPAVKTKQI